MLDKEYVTPETLGRFVNTNEEMLKGKPVAIVMEFPGLGGGSCLGGHCDNAKYDTIYARELAQKGILLIYCCPGPWSWMNKGAVKYSDLCLDAALEKFGLDSKTPIAATGGSMGGLGALMWTTNTRHNVVACAAACPCFSALQGFDAHPQFGRTFLDAVLAYDMPVEEALKTISPIYNVHRMKNVPYFIVGDCEDECFPIEGIDDLVTKMRERGFSVDYRRLDDLKHGEFTTEARGDLTKFVIANVVK